MAQQVQRVRLSIMAWTFLFTNAVYGLGFATLGKWSGVGKSSLYQSLNETWTWMPEAWGIVTLMASFLSLLAIFARSGRLGSIGASLGIGSWLFASWVYALTGFWLVVVTVGVLYLMFWVSYWLSYISRLSDKGLNGTRA